MTRYKREVELTAKPETEYRFPIYANRVDIKRVASSENWLIASLSVNFGVNISYFADNREANEATAREDFTNGDYFLSGTTLSAWGTYPEGDFTFYTLDLKELIPEGWDFAVTRIGSGLRQIGVIAYVPGFAHELEDVHILDPTDLNAWGDKPCDGFFKDAWGNKPEVPCQRDLGHLGDHQAIHDERVYNWTASGSSSASPYLLFGFTCRCPICGEVDAGGNTGLKMCFGCEHWLRLEKERNMDSFIINGRHYMPGKGGFGGQKFKIRRHDGTTWEGELFTQGEVPAWMKDRFLDNAEFVVEKTVTTDTSGTATTTVYSGSLAAVQSVAWDELRRLADAEDF